MTDREREPVTTGALRRAQGLVVPVDYSARRRYRRPPRRYVRLQWLGWVLTRLGLSPGFVTLLKVPGRRTGTIRRTNLAVTAYGGARYLVSLGGESEWARNVRAAGGRVTIGRRRRSPAMLHEIPPQERSAIIRAYIQREGRASPTSAARTARYYFGFDADPPEAELRRIALYYPVFRIEKP